MNENPSSATPDMLPGLLKSLCTAYADLLQRQGSAASPFVYWSQVTGRVPAFAWLGDALSVETLLWKSEPLVARAGTRLFEALKAMSATVTLNPYERELLYGYPYIVGLRAGDVIRAPVLLMPIQVEGEAGELRVSAADEVVRFNSLPFRGDADTDMRELAIRSVVEATPSLPLLQQALESFADRLVLDLGVERRGACLDGRIAKPPDMPTRDQGLWLIDQAAIFIAPKTAYFLTSDLKKIGDQDTIAPGVSSLGNLLSRAGPQPHVEISNDDVDRHRIYYPFPSNRAQRRVAVLLEDPTTTVVRVEGPPGTGKSQTIANLACHLAATGRTVLITSQKDKALQVVDEMLRGLSLAELPMTLLRQDKSSKRDLLERLERIKKERGREEVHKESEGLEANFATAAGAYVDRIARYANAVGWEERVESTHRQFKNSRGARRLIRQARFLYTRARSHYGAPQGTDEIASEAAEHRQNLRALALRALQLGREHAVASASRQERQTLRELAQVLQRNQTLAKNFSLFDRLKDDPQRAAMLLRLLPVWIMSPEDVARLFPCQAGLFDVVVVDEASQVDLPSIAPVVFRGQKLAIFGDTKQMQPRRFLFMNQNVMLQSWQQAGMDHLDPERWLHPAGNSLLVLANTRAEEEVLLDEHFRSLPPIIQFSNREWYGNHLRIMTDEQQKAFGSPEQRIVELHHVPGARISNGSQENEMEARALLEHLSSMVQSPDYSGASIGVICLFEEQAALLQELVASHIPEDEWEEHELVVVSPDGFQGDERDIVLYSLSWDNDVMPRQALSQRQRQHPHEQGMLNVAFTRARDEVHIFHSAPIRTFTMADGRPGTLTRWLMHCEAVQAAGRAKPPGTHIARVDSEFEAEVAAALRQRGVFVIHQYPACGFHIDLVCEKDGARVGVECDGERYHLDEHGQPKLEDLERDAILRRAGWRIIRMPYRKWLRVPQGQVKKVLEGLDEERAERTVQADEEESRAAPPPLAAQPRVAQPSVRDVTPTQEAIIKALREGLKGEEDMLYRVRDLVDSRRLTDRLRRQVLAEAQALEQQQLVTIEDHEYFLTPEGREAQFRTIVPWMLPSRGYTRRRYRRRY